MPPATAASLVAALLACGLLVYASALDQQHQPHKAHEAPVATLGGVGVWIGFCVGLLLAPPDRLALLGSDLAILLAVALSIGAVGLVDDLYGLSPKLRLVLMVVFSGLVVWSLGPVTTLFFPNSPVGVSLPAAIGVGGSVLWLLVVINAVNFFDGSNGLSIGSGALSLCGIAVLLVRSGAPEWGGVALILAAACVGLVIWNMAGYLYAGDVGAYALALMVGGFGLVAAQQTDAFLVALCLLPMLADVVLTVIWRWRNREALLQPHRQHLYQWIRRSGVGPGMVAAGWWLATALCCLSAVTIQVNVQQGTWPVWSGSIALFGLVAGSILINRSVRHRLAKQSLPQ